MISVITPLHEPGNMFVEEAYRSLVAQTETSWEWVVLENHGGTVPEYIRKDGRVRVLTAKDILQGIGALKRTACKAARGDMIVELDADDLLLPEALAHVREALAESDFCYSDFAEFQSKEDGTLRTSEKEYPYGAVYGWSHYEVEVEGSTLLAMRAPEVTAHNIRLIDWAPNHVRAWRHDAYWRIGGHDPRLEVGDDHDLIVRMFLEGCSFRHIAKCLYLYRVHGDNTVAARNAEIRSATWSVYNTKIWKLAEKWAEDGGYEKIDLCGAVDAPDGYTPIDRKFGAGTVRSRIECNLDGPWALDTSSVGVLRAQDALEHLVDPVHTMSEAWRVLAPGGWLFIQVPASNGLGAFCDPTHKSFWNRLSFRYYSDPKFAKYVSEFRGKFQVARVLEWFPSEWHRENNVPYVEALLFAVKDDWRAMGEFLWT